MSISDISCASVAPEMFDSITKTCNVEVPVDVTITLLPPSVVYCNNGKKTLVQSICIRTRIVNHTSISKYVD